MDDIFNLVGKIIKEFQGLEENLALLIYFAHLPENSNFEPSIEDSKIKAINEWSKADERTFGYKLGAIQKLRFFEEENDILVLGFLKDKRNYIAHHFFVDNTFDNEVSIEKHRKELSEILNWSKTINSAVAKMVQQYI